jgi:phosphatidylglycerophosphate synthase
MLDSSARHFVQPAIDRGARIFHSLGVSPNAATGVAFATGLLAVLAYAYGFSLFALSLLWISGFFDVTDGTLARLSGRVSPLGTLFDLLGDRLVEAAFIVATALLFPESRLACVLLLASIIFSFSIFLIVGMLSEKAEKMGKSFYYQAGLAERTETFIVFSLVILWPEYSAHLFYLFAAMIVFTGCQRFREACGYLK